MPFDKRQFNRWSQSTQVKFLFQLMKNCNPTLGNAFLKHPDQILANCYQSHPQLMSIPDATGKLPLWHAFKKHLTTTLQTIIESDATPRHEGRIICSYQPNEPFISTPVYFTVELDSILYNLSYHSSDDFYEISVIHQLIPYLNTADCAQVGERLLQNVVDNPFPYEALSVLIKKGWNLETKVANLSTGQLVEFATSFIQAIEHKNAINVRSLFGVEAMLFTPYILDMLITLGQKNGENAFLCRKFPEIVADIVDTAGGLANGVFYARFTYAMPLLKQYGVDLRLYRYFDGKNLTEMLLTYQPTDFSRCMDFLGRIDGPTAHLYRPSRFISGGQMPCTMSDLPLHFRR